MFYYFLRRSLLQNFIKDSQTIDIVTAAKHFLSDVNIQIKKRGEIPNFGPVLVICNHPTSLDLFIYLSLLKREDSYLISAVINDVLGSNFIKHRLPIYFKKSFFLSRIFSIFNNQPQEQKEIFSQPETRRRNINTISQAAKLISAGHLVTIFPTGGDFMSKKAWKNGVGFLTNQITNDQTQIVFAHIKNITRKEQIRLFVPVNKKFFKLKTVEVEFSQPIPISDFTMEKIDPKSLTKNLKKAYFEFCQKKTNLD